ncbi:holin [Enterobacteria phage PRDfuchsia]
MMENDEWWKYLIFPLIATLGGIVNYSKRALAMKRFSKLEFAVEAVSAAFVGLMVTLGGAAMDLSPHWLGMAAGMSGWMGADFVKAVFTSFVKSKIGPIESGQSIENDNDQRGANLP